MTKNSTDTSKVIDTIYRLEMHHIKELEEEVKRLESDNEYQRKYIGRIQGSAAAREQQLLNDKSQVIIDMSRECNRLQDKITKAEEYAKKATEVLANINE